MGKIDTRSRFEFGSPWSRISPLLLLAAIGLFCGPDCRAQELIRDSFFTRGLNAKGLVPTTAVLGPLQVATNNGAPIWGLSEWWSQATVYGTAPIVRPSGAYCWSNAYKQVTLPAGTSTDSDVILYVDSIAEYHSQFRQSGQQWPHLLVEQTLRHNNTHWLSDLDEVRFHLEARLNSAYNKYGSGHNSRLHGAQFVIYYTIQNLAGGAGHGDFLWFGLKLYDDRYAKPGLYANWDKGTSKYIYNIGIPFTDTGMTVGQWKTISGDLLPHIKTAFTAARAAGALPDSGNLADYKIGGMNMGWEVSGLSRVEMQFRNYSLAYTPKGPTPPVPASGTEGP